MHLSAKSDYAVRAAVQLAGSPDRPVKGEAIAHAQDIPFPFLGSILRDLREAGIVNSQRGADGGYWLAKSATEITVADVIRAIDGPLARVRGVRPEDLEYAGPARALQDVWIAARASLRDVLEAVTLADVAGGRLPASVRALTAEPSAWEPHRGRVRPLGVDAGGVQAASGTAEGSAGTGVVPVDPRRRGRSSPRRRPRRR